MKFEPGEECLYVVHNYSEKKERPPYGCRIVSINEKGGTARVLLWSLEKDLREDKPRTVPIANLRKI